MLLARICFVLPLVLLILAAWLSRLLTAILVAALTVAWLFDGGEQAPPRKIGGKDMQHLLDAIPLLQAPLSRLQYPALLQLVFVALTNIVGKHKHSFEAEAVPVKLEGVQRSSGVVWLQWLRRDSELPADSPIVMLVPGLGNTKDSLPGFSIYDLLQRKPWRVVVYEKRGVGASAGKLQTPIFHIFGHPSDLRTAVLKIRARYPRAPLHFVSYSAGNGLVGSYLREFGAELGTSARGALMLMGGEDYNKACKFRDSCVSDRMVEARLLHATKKYFLGRNESVLRAHNAAAFDAALAADNLHDFYLATMRGFSGFDNPAEAEERINGFRGGNAWIADYRGIPSLGVYTADDPIGWILAPEWIKNLQAAPKMAAAVFQHGNHCACYNVGGGRWIDDLVIQWVTAVEAAASAVPCTNVSQ
jgi:predicted alpha/beta-fold hydrolase